MLEIPHKPSGEVLRIDTFWLRDHCRCKQCYNSETKQRNYNLLDLPATVRPVEHGYSTDELEYSVTWSDGHYSSYNLDFLLASQLDQVVARSQMFTLRTPWNRAHVLQHGSQLRVPLSELVRSEAKVNQLVGNLIRYGIVFIDEVPPNTTMTELAVRRLFPVMKTFFGEMYKFADNPDHSDSAYTRDFLGAHTDNTYFCDAAGLQVLHCLQHVNGTGGENFFVDGLHAAQELKRRNPGAFEILSNVQVPSEYIEEGQYHKHSAPIIRIDPVTEEIEQVRLNVYDRAVFDTIPQEEMRAFYASFREFLQIVQEAKNQWVFKLHPGTVVLFDNWRVCHGRESYTGQRVMTGCYVQRTDFLSKARLLGIID